MWWNLALVVWIFTTPVFPFRISPPSQRNSSHTNAKFFCQLTRLKITCDGVRASVAFMRRALWRVLTGGTLTQAFTLSPTHQADIELAVKKSLIGREKKQKIEQHFGSLIITRDLERICHFTDVIPAVSASALTCLSSNTKSLSRYSEMSCFVSTDMVNTTIWCFPNAFCPIID